MIRAHSEEDDCCGAITLCKTLEREADELREVAIACLEWIDAVPQDTVLPSMPGFNRDWADEIIARAALNTETKKS